jgi:hypothetical protein
LTTVPFCSGMLPILSIKSMSKLIIDVLNSQSGNSNQPYMPVSDAYLNCFLSFSMPCNFFVGYTV